MSRILTRRSDWIDNLCTLRRRSGDIPVQSGLALTPRRVKELTEKGVAVSTSNSEGIFDAPRNPSDWSFDSMYERGTDRCVLWERSQLAKRKILSSRDKLTVKERAELSNKD